MSGSNRDEGVRMRKTKTTEQYLRVLSESVPSSVAPYVQSSIPYLVQTANAAEASIPYFQLAYSKICELIVQLEPYRLDLLLPALVGLVMAFFGGSFFALIAAVEAYRMVGGWEKQLQLVKDLGAEFSHFAAISAADDKVDADGDGVADVLQVSPQQLRNRKMLLFLETVDPRRLSESLNGLQSGFMAVLATLKLEFAKAITLGSALGHMLQKPSDAFLLPALEAALPVEYKRWASPVLTGLIKSATISFAWFLQRVISAFHSAMRGGLLFSRNVLEYLDRMKIVSIRADETHLDEVVGYVVGALGLWCQLSTGFSLPFPLNVLMLPFSLAEYFLMWMINSK